MGWNGPAVSGCAIGVRPVGSRGEYLGAGGANTICSAALDMMRTLAAAVN